MSPLTFAKPPAGLLTDEDAAWIGDNLATAPEDRKPFYAAKLNEYRAFRSEYPRQLTDAELEAQRKDRERIEAIFDDFDKATDGLQFESLRFAGEADRPKLKQRLANAAFLQHVLPAANRDELHADHELFRRDFANRYFSGKGADDEAGFNAAAKEWLSAQRDERGLNSDLMRAGVAAAVARIGAGEAQGFDVWDEGAQSKPGYATGRSAAYRATFLEAERATRDRLAPMAGALNQAWEALTGGGDLEALTERIGANIPEADRRAFLLALKQRADMLPDTQRPKFFANLAKATKRDVGGFFRGMGDAAQGFFTGQSVLNGGDAVAVEGRAFDARQALAEHNLETDLRDILEGRIDPLKTIIGPDHPIFRAIEEGAYHAPGALTSTATAMIPVVGQGAFFASMAADAYDGERRRLSEAGFSDADASRVAVQLAPAIAAPQAILERLGVEAVLGKLPGVSKALNGLADKATSAAAQYAIRAGGTGAVELVQERLQDFVPAVVDSLAAAASQDMPGVQWQGEGGVFDGFWAQNLETAVALAPMALIGGAVQQVGAKARREAVAKASDVELRAFGIPQTEIDKIRAAESAGPFTADAVIEAAAEKRDAKSDEAKAAVAELQKQIQEQRKAQFDGQASGLLPTYRAVPGGFQVFHDGKSVGFAPTVTEAMQLGAVASEAKMDFEDDQTALLGAMLETAGEFADQEAGDVAKVTEVNQSPVTVAQRMAEAAAEADTMTEERLMEQVRLYEASTGRSGGSLLVMGENAVTFKDRIATSLSAINGGASPLTVVHENAHGAWRAGMQNGTFTREGTVLVLRQVEAATGQKFLQSVDDAAIGDTELDEAVAELAEAEVLGTRKGQHTIAPGAIRRALTRFSGGTFSTVRDGKRIEVRSSEGEARGFRHMLYALRAMMGQVFRRAMAIRKAKREGKLGADYQQFVDRLLGIDSQASHEQAMVEEATALQDQLDYVPPTAEEEEAGIAFSLAPFKPAEWAARGYRAKVDAWERGEDIGRAEISLGPTPLALRAAGASERGLMVAPSLFRKVTEDRHAVPVEALRALPESLADPIAIFQSRRDVGEGSAFLVLTEFSEPGRGPVVAAVHLEKQSANNLVVHRVASLYGKPTAAIADLFNESPLYVNPQKSREWARTVRKQYPEVRISPTRLQDNTATPEDVVKLSQAQGRGGAAFSLAPAAMVARVEDSLQKALDRDPAQKRRIFRDMLRRLGGLISDYSTLRWTVNGKEVKPIGAKRSKASLDKEQAFREAARRAELTDLYAGTVEAELGGVLFQPELAKFTDHPLMILLGKSKKGIWRGRIMSPKNAARLDDVRGISAKHGDYDGADGVPSMFFGGNERPDTLAQEAFEAGLIKDATPDDLWEGIRSAVRSVAKGREDLNYALDKLREAQARARSEAKAEAAAWRKETDAAQRRDHSPRAALLRAFAVLDAMVMALPAELRAKVGGYAAIARLTTDAAMLKELQARADKIGELVETYLQQQYRDELKRLFDLARPKGGTGEKAGGKIGAEGHSWFEIAEEAAKMTELQTDDRLAALEAELAGDEIKPARLHELSRMWSVPIKTDAEGREWIEAQITLTRVFGGALAGAVKDSDGKVIAAPMDAAGLEAAVRWAADVYHTGRLDWIHELTLRKEWREGIARMALVNVGGEYDPAKHNRMNRPGSAKAAARNVEGFADRHLTMEGQVANVFGVDSTTHNVVTGWIRRSSNALVDAVKARHENFATFMRETLGGRWKVTSQKRMQAMQTPRATGFKGVHAFLSEMQAVHMLTQAQEPTTREWLAENGWSDRVLADLAGWISPEARAVADWLAREYDAQYDRINAVHMRLYGVALPRVQNYVPRLVEHGGKTKELSLDQENAAGMITGFLRRRVQKPGGPPKLADALAVYWANAHVVEHWIAWAETIGDMRATILSRDVRLAAETHVGAQKFGKVLANARILEENGIREAIMQSEVGSFLRRLYDSNTAAALLGKWTIFAKQIPAAFASAARIGLGRYLASSARVLTGQGAMGLGEMWDNPIVQRRIDLYDDWARNAMRKDKAKAGFINAAMRWNGEALGWVDAMFTTLSAAAAYDAAFREATDAGIGEKQAKRIATERADLVVSQTAQPMTADAKSLMELESGMLGRIFFAFQGPSRVMFATLWEATKNARQDKRQFLNAWTAIAVLMPIAMQTIGNLIRTLQSDDDPEEIFSLEGYLKAMVASPFQGMIFVGNGVDYLFRHSVSPRLAVNPLNDAGSALAQALDALNRGDFDESEAVGTLRALALLLGGRASAWNVSQNLATQLKRLLTSNLF